MTANRDPGPHSDVPGPGTYSMEESKGRSGPSYSMRHRETSSRPTSAPGPGNYDPSYRTSKENTPSYPFGSKHRDQSPEGPGPGQYNPDIPSSPQKGYTIPGKRSEGPLTDSPGPGAYSMDDPKGRSGPSYSMR